MKQFNIFISYYYNEAREYIEKIKKFLETEFNDINIIYERVNYKLEGLDDKAITKIIRENYLRISNLVIILLSKNAWKRKHIDWELSASLRHTKSNSKKPVIAILTPDYGTKFLPQTDKTSIRMIRNVENNYIETIFWNNFFNVNNVKEIIDKARENSKKINPINNDILRRKNKGE
ncbi:MAG: TIR domain-containing protein [Spiroplasma sp.]